MNVCKQCGKPQNDGGVLAPMVHMFGGDSHHLDCLPYELEQALTGKHGPRIEAAKNAVRGDELRAVTDNDVEG